VERKLTSGARQRDEAARPTNCASHNLIKN